MWKTTYHNGSLPDVKCYGHSTSLLVTSAGTRCEKSISTDVKCHKRHATNLPARISSLKDRISDFELKGESWICWMRRLKRCMGVRRSCFRYLGLILVFVGNSQGFSG